MERRHDIDWLRVIAIGLLIVYHSAIGFQPWGALIGFIQNSESLAWIWYPMAMLNMWRIPILFFVSGMGVFFSMKKRGLIKLLLERSQRILIPFIFGVFAIVPIHIIIWQNYYYQDIQYSFGQSHLWFLLNIIIYTLIISPLVYWIRRTKMSIWIQKIQKWSVQPLVFILVTILYVLESNLLKPELYTLYAFTNHGYLMGFISFGAGFFMMSLSKDFWECFKIWKWFYAVLAIVLFSIRIIIYDLEAPYYLMSIESAAWIFAVFGFFYHYANHSGAILHYLSKAAYPVYIIHMIVQYGISSLLFPLGISANLKLLILIPGTLGLCMLFYHFIIRKFNFIKPLFGLKI